MAAAMPARLAPAGDAMSTARSRSRPASGALDEIAFYNAALSAQQIAAIYNAPQGECP